MAAICNGQSRDKRLLTAADLEARKLPRRLVPSREGYDFVATGSVHSLDMKIGRLK
jgi:hypothetical protein